LQSIAQAAARINPTSPLDEGKDGRYFLFSRKDQRMSQSLADLLNLYDAAAPLEEAFTIPAPWYVDRRIEQAEREAVFGANWISVGRIDQVAVEGQFFTLEIAGEPLVVVRGSDGELRAFFNVCRHHAAAVANVPCGTVQHLRCPYHGA
jgi:choline monooxygenase